MKRSSDHRTAYSLVAGALLAAGCAASPAARVADLAEPLRAVGAEGAGHREAAAAARELSALPPELLPEILAAMDGASPRARNWLRAAVDAVAERALAEKRPLPTAALETFALERSHDPRARRLAYEWLLRVEPAAAERLVPGFIDDPSNELRRDALERELAAAAAALERDGKEAGLAAYRRVFAAARDPDQVSAVAKKLEELGERPDLARHYGFLRSWRVVAPFDNSKSAGFAAAFQPEEAIDFEAEHAGKDGAALRWRELASNDPMGLMDLNAAYGGKPKGVLAYAAAEIESAGERRIELRAASPNALKIWLNGELVFQRNEYHHGNEIDQHQAAAVLRPGRNRVLVKVCQNEQTEDWAQEWRFQLRVCDATGGGAL